MIILLLKVWSKEILAPCGHRLCSYQLPISVHGVLGLCTKYDNLSLTNSLDISKLFHSDHSPFIGDEWAQLIYYCAFAVVFQFGENDNHCQ